MIRWKYLLPRLGILLFLFLLINLTSDSLTRWLIVHSGQSITGARIDIGTLDASPWSGQLVLSDIQIADPRSPFNNLLQLDSAELSLDTGRMLNRQWVVTQAKLGHVQFGTPRTESGELPNHPISSSAADANLPQQLLASFESQAKAWIDDLTDQVPGLIEDNLETVRTARSIAERWPEEFQAQKQTADELKRRANELKQTLEQQLENPLRNLNRYHAAIEQARQLQADVEAAKRDLHQLTQQFNLDRKKLIAAKQRDEAKIQSRIGHLEISPASMTELLMGKQKADVLREVVSWTQWFRNALPDPETDFQPVRGRGYDVPFRRYPGLVFRNLQLDGEGKIAGQHFHFAGVAKNLSTAPQLLAEPTTFQLRGQGHTHVLVNATVDRRGPRKIDTVNISCPRIAIPAKILGPDESLAVGLHPSDMSFELNARLVDEHWTGQIAMHHSNVQLRVERLHESIGGSQLVESLNKQLGNINRFDVTIGFSGEISDPEVQLASDLGEKFAGAMKHVFRNTMETAVASNLAKLDSILQDELSRIDELFQANAGQIMSMLTKEIPVVADLQHWSGDNGLPNLNSIR